MAYPVFADYTRQFGNDNSPTVTYSGTPQAGDILIWICAVDAQDLFSVPAEFTEVTFADGQMDNAGCETRVAYRVCDGTEGTDPTYTASSSSDQWIAAVCRITGGADPADRPFVTRSRTRPSDPSQFSLSALATHDSLALFGVSVDARTIVLTPADTAGRDLRFTTGSGGEVRIGLCSDEQIALTSEGSNQWTFDGGGGSHGWTLLIAEPAAGAGTQSATASGADATLGASGPTVAGGTAATSAGVASAVLGAFGPVAAGGVAGATAGAADATLAAVGPAAAGLTASMTAGAANLTLEAVGPLFVTTQYATVGAADAVLGATAPRFVTDELLPPASRIVRAQAKPRIMQASSRSRIVRAQAKPRIITVLP